MNRKSHNQKLRKLPGPIPSCPQSNRPAARPWPSNRPRSRRKFLVAHRPEILRTWAIPARPSRFQRPNHTDPGDIWRQFHTKAGAWSITYISGTRVAILLDETFRLSIFRKILNHFLTLWGYKRHQNVLNKASNVQFNTPNCLNPLFRVKNDQFVLKSIIKTSATDRMIGARWLLLWHEGISIRLDTTTVFEFDPRSFETPLIFTGWDWFGSEGFVSAWIWNSAFISLFENVEICVPKKTPLKNAILAKKASFWISVWSILVRRRRKKMLFFTQKWKVPLFFLEISSKSIKMCYIDLKNISKRIFFENIFRYT